MAVYGGNVRNARADGSYPASKVTSVRYFRDLVAGGAWGLQDVLTGIYRGALGERETSL
jgi:hypothetical protein